MTPADPKRESRGALAATSADTFPGTDRSDALPQPRVVGDVGTRSHVAQGGDAEQQEPSPLQYPTDHKHDGVTHVCPAELVQRGAEAVHVPPEGRLRALRRATSTGHDLDGDEAAHSSEFAQPSGKVNRCAPMTGRGERDDADAQQSTERGSNSENRASITARPTAESSPPRCTAGEDFLMSGIFYCGDNLEVLGTLGLVPAESVDLIYLDPPFNSQQTYNVTYKDSRAQAEAFKDHWSWEEAAPAYSALLEAPDTPAKLRALLRGLREMLIDDDADLLAYLTMMAPRLVAMYRVLKPTGSLYLHCDPTASHYLKVVLDTLFRPGAFGNEIVWRRTNARRAEDRWPRLHDILLFYRKGEEATFRRLEIVGDRTKVPHTLITGPDGKKYQTYELTAPNLRYGETGKVWRGFQPADYGRCWANLPSVMDEWDRQGLIHWPKKKGAWPRRISPEPFEPGKRMVTVGDVWTDIDRLNQTAKERIGYPTQKPVALLRRIIEASSKPGDVVLDPFCGCGTTIEACEQLGRRWIGIDIARKAVEITEERFEKLQAPTPTVEWYPPDRDAAAALAARDPHGFERWVRQKIRAVRQRKKDRGIDGEAFFRDEANRITHVLVSVKGGKLNPAMVRELRGTMERERVPVGALVTLHEPSKEMRREATHAGFLPQSDGEGQIPRLQLVTVDRLFSDHRPIRAPGVNVTEMPKPTVPLAPKEEQLQLRLEPPKPPQKTKPSPRPPMKVSEPDTPLFKTRKA